MASKRFQCQRNEKEKKKCRNRKPVFEDSSYICAVYLPRNPSKHIPHSSANSLHAHLYLTVLNRSSQHDTSKPATFHLAPRTRHQEPGTRNQYHRTTAYQTLFTFLNRTPASHQTSAVTSKSTKILYITVTKNITYPTLRKA